MTPELLLLSLISILFLVPKLLQRFGLPSAVTSFGLGFVAPLLVGDILGDPVVRAFSTFGIVSLFLFAGLEVEMSELKRMRWTLAQHVLARIGLLAVVAWAGRKWLGLDVRPAILVALALLTPSAGFIIDSLGTFGASDHERAWIKAKAISAELLALAVLFFVVQSNSAVQISASLVAMIALVLLVPVFFRAYARFIHPHAPNSEFGVIMVLGTIGAIITKYLGVYYLVGAFLVGFAGRRFGASLGAKSYKKLVASVQTFAAFFIPFYFFHTGTRIGTQGIVAGAWPLAALFVLIGVPVRLGGDLLQRKIMLKEHPQVSVRIAVALLPTLVFNLVIAQILKDSFAISDALYGALAINAVLTTLIPAIFFSRSPMTALENPELDDAQRA